jgi:hypothetical protein
MDDIFIHPNKYVLSNSIPKKKHFIFDIDETLGSFSDMYCLWKGIQSLVLKKGNNVTFDQNTFNEIMNLYPEFLRYGITTILEYLYHKKKKKQCGFIFVYTNNQCDPPWIELIISYFETQFDMKGLFEKPISAFKINNKRIDSRRTSHEKSYSDFLKCTLLSKNSELCFVDDLFFPKMLTDQVFYVQPKPYFHSLGKIEIIERFISSKINKTHFLITKESLTKLLSSSLQLNKTVKTRLEKENDIDISRKLMCTIREFFYLVLKKEKTRRNRFFLMSGKFTRKQRFRFP